MQYRTLGRAGLSASVFGLGCGGHSRLGLRQGKGEENARRIVGLAIESGVNFFDTAEAYGTETIVGEAIARTNAPRKSLIVSTKVSPRQGDALRTADEIRQAAENGLQRLRLDYIDVLHLHGVSVADYPYVVSEHLPVLQSLREKGHIRFTGITEAFAPDPGHEMLQRALQDDYWDVIMVGFNLINQSARERVLTATRAKNVGTLDMFAVRRALSHLDALKRLIADLKEQGRIDRDALDDDDPLGFAVRESGAETLPNLAYRFCRDEPGMDVILSGTGDPDHLRENLRSLADPPLPATVTQQLRKIFARVDNVSGN